MKKWIVVGALLLVVGGCAGLKQAKSDYTVGKTTPIAVGETSPVDIVKSVVDPVVPFIPAPLQPVAGVLTLLATAFFTWKRGREIRLGKTSGSVSDTSWLGVTLTAVSDVFKGVYEVGPDGSPVKRSWKTFVNLALSLAGAAVTVPAAKTLILSHPDIVGLITIVASTLAGIEKELGNLPVPPSV